MRTTYIVIFIIYFVNHSFGQILPKIESLIKVEMKSKDIAGMAVAVIDSGKVVHLSAYGFRDLENNLKATINTPFQIASVSKTVTNLAVFKLVELGKIELSDDVNNYLPFSVKNPHFSNDSITVRDLLNHRSGIRDDMAIYDTLWNIPKGDRKIALDKFMYDYLDPNGKLYKKNHYDNTLNYNAYKYSDTGVALLGVIVENVSGKSFDDFCQENIFEPLNMTNTGWFLRNFDHNLVAKPYVKDDSLGLIFKGHNGFPDYPGGQLRTSIHDYSILLAGYLNAENGKFVLKKETVLKITPSPRQTHEGFFSWFLMAINNEIYYYHTGADPGTRTISVMNIDHKRGVVIFLNSDSGNARFSLLSAIGNEMWGK